MICMFLTLRHLKYGRAVRCHQSEGMPAWHPDQIVHYAWLAVVPVIRIIRFVRGQAKDIAGCGTSKAENRAIGIVEIGGDLVDLENLAIRIAGLTQAVDNGLLHAARVTGDLARIFHRRLLGIIQWCGINIARFNGVSDCG